MCHRCSKSNIYGASTLNERRAEGGLAWRVRQLRQAPGVLFYMRFESAAQAHREDVVMAGPGAPQQPTADAAVTALYRKQAGSLIRLAVVILRDPAMAEDV